MTRQDCDQYVHSSCGCRLEDAVDSSVEDRELWLERAPRNELVDRIRELEAREKARDEVLEPAMRWLTDRFGRASGHDWAARGVVSKLDESDPSSAVQVLLELAQHAARIAAADGKVLSFLSDYRPDLVAQIIATRRNHMTRLTNDWPAAALADYLRNVLVDRINCPVRTGYAHLPSILYWAGVLERYSTDRFNILADHRSVDRDRGDTEFAEGREVALSKTHPKCPYDRDQYAFKAAMWWQGYRTGYGERFFPRQ
ncbi:hypothetical protein QZM82_39155 [Burkholderia cepacia]|uniref:hypothetical protein n=1 Tax=Burkholderia cepacia TaxID=292 RepID=UPI00264AE4AE|nr:hypothetical protein [Burkholderia cepacia]MDN7902216.1 hypothetical protein [Burkholderia cepacia]